MPSFQSERQQDLLLAIREAARGNVYFPPGIERRMATLGVHGTEAPQAKLSERELEIFKMMASGLTNTEMAEKVGLSTAGEHNQPDDQGQAGCLQTERTGDAGGEAQAGTAVTGSPGAYITAAATGAAIAAVWAGGRGNSPRTWTGLMVPLLTLSLATAVACHFGFVDARGVGLVAVLMATAVWAMVLLIFAKS